MIKSMTGFSRQVVDLGNELVTIEIKGVNNRFLDIVVKMPEDFSFLEEEIKSVAKLNVNRGRVDIKLKWKNNQESHGGEINKDYLEEIVRKSNSIAEELNLDAPKNIENLLLINGVVVEKKLPTDEKVLRERILNSLKICLIDFNSMRSREGERLKLDIEYRVNIIREVLSNIKQLQHLVVDEYRDKLNQRISQLRVKGLEFDDNRLMGEVALFAERCSITEEIVRLDSHLEEFDKNINNEDAVGRKLDFLLQEVNREINTIGSKANIYKISKLVVDIKGEAEKIREQIQNIE